MSDTVEARIAELMSLHKQQLARMIAESEAAGVAPNVAADPSMATATASVDDTNVA